MLKKKFFAGLLSVVAGVSLAMSSSLYVKAAELPTEQQINATEQAYMSMLKAGTISQQDAQNKVMELEQLRNVLKVNAASAASAAATGSSEPAGFKATSENSASSNGRIVQTGSALYTYPDMMQDVKQLADKYPGIVSWKNLSTTGQGRSIPVVFLGNPKAPHHVMIQASMHAREYMSSQILMAILEHYASNYNTGSFNGTPYSKLFSDTCFVLLPMVNPDGVSISQFGTAAVTTPVQKQFWTNISATFNLTQIKANANGVDINKNFPTGFGSGVTKAPAPEFYFGPSAASEAESKALIAAADMYDYSAYINYHTMGNVIYDGSGAAAPMVNAKSDLLASILHAYNNYNIIGYGVGSRATGTFADYLCVVKGRPSATVEFGTANPVPISQFPAAYNLNVNTWAAVAYFVMSGQL